MMWLGTYELSNSFERLQVYHLLPVWRRCQEVSLKDSELVVLCKASDFQCKLLGV